jgi:hypothetical protein
MVGEASEEPLAEHVFWAFYTWRGFGHPSIGDGTAPGEDSARVPVCACVFGGRFSPMIRVPLTMVPDSSPRASGRVRDSVRGLD